MTKEKTVTDFKDLKAGDAVWVRSTNGITKQTVTREKTIFKITSQSIWLDSRGIYRFRRSDGTQIDPGGIWRSKLKKENPNVQS